VPVRVDPAAVAVAHGPLVRALGTHNPLDVGIAQELIDHGRESIERRVSTRLRSWPSCRLPPDVPEAGVAEIGCEVHHHLRRAAVIVSRALHQSVLKMVPSVAPHPG